jgi:hypothetical protein
MTLQLDRRRILVKGLSTIDVRELDPSADADYTNIGYHESTDLNIASTVVEYMDETGILVDVPEQSRLVTGVTQLMQSSKVEMDFLVAAAGKYHALRFYGMAGPGRFQYWSFPAVKIKPGFTAGYKPGKRLLAMTWYAQNISDAFAVPEFYMTETADEIDVQYVRLWVNPRDTLNVGTLKLLDESGWERHGTLDSTAMWQLVSGVRFIRFDGATQKVSFGDILDDDASGDFAVEMWVKVQAADSSIQEILAKKNDLSNDTAGYGFYRNASNKIVFKLSSGSASATLTGAANILQNVWHHVAVAIDRNGNGQLYMDGAADGSAASVAAITTGANALDLLLGGDNTTKGQVDIGGVRFYRWAGGSLPTTIATTMATHFGADRTYYGV